MARQVFRRPWALLAALSLVAGGLIVGVAAAQDQSDRKDSSERSSRIQKRDRQPNRDQSDRQTRGQADQNQRDQDQGTPWLGVWLGRSSSQKNPKGAGVERVFPGSPAARAGLEAGDMITEINGDRINGPDDLVSAVDDEKPGARMKFTVLRDEKQESFDVVLGDRQDMDFSDRVQGPGNDQFGGPSGPFGQFGGRTLPPYAMQLEHDRRNFEQHERIENEIARLRAEVRELRDMLQQQLQR